MMTTYLNPVIPGFFPDPSIVKVDGDYYLATSSFEYYPGVPIFHSQDLLNWRLIGHALTRNSQIDLSDRKSSEGIYAPTLRYHNGTFYMITTDVMGIGNFYVTAANPAGPWSDPIGIPYGNIDPSLMFDEDGKVYVTAQNGFGEDSHIIQYEIDIETGKALSEPVVICRGDGGVWTEGPHLFKIHGIYYIICSCGGTSVDHRCLVGKSDSPYGPFDMLPFPILTHNRLPNHAVQNLGHADFVEDANGEWWAVFLAVRPVDHRYSVLGRETFLAPIQWTEEGWPMIDNNEGMVSLSMMTSREMLGTQQYPGSVKDDFDKEDLDLEWVFLRTCDAKRISLSARNSALTLFGNEWTMRDEAPTLFVGRRQQHARMQATVLLEFAPEQEGEEAGLCVRLNEQGHATIGMRYIHNQCKIVVTTANKGEYKEFLSNIIHGSTVYFSIRSDVHTYVLAYSLDGTKWTEVAEIPASIVAPEVNGGFTGALLGMYATGNGTVSRAPAYFDFFDYQVNN